MHAFNKKIQMLILPNAKSHGFTLVELMIAVAIIGILTAIAIPNYRDYVIRSNRSAVQAYMLEIANKEKQYLLDARAYTASKTDLGVTDPAEISSRYDVTIAPAVTPPSFVITATAKGAQLSDGNLTLDNLGNKGPAGKW